MLVRPKQTPCTKKYCRFIDAIDFAKENKVLVRAFKFAPKAPGIAAHQFVPDEQWEQLATTCHKHGIVPSNLSFDPIMCTNTVSIYHSKAIVPWYHSSLDINEAIHQSLAS